MVYDGPHFTDSGVLAEAYLFARMGQAQMAFIAVALDEVPGSAVIDALDGPDSFISGDAIHLPKVISHVPKDMTVRALWAGRADRHERAIKILILFHFYN